ncbi:thioredoxin family protein [Vibrio metschnikovii]|uniref:thioredoxin family protein n=1 Tax=Vibrio metschnikovii TaxID=28172 RepID=UPI003326107F
MNFTGIKWYSADDYQKVLNLSKESGRPILLDLHSPSCNGCIRLDREVYSNSEVSAIVNDITIPLRVITDNPSDNDRSIINNHIFVMSSTVQLLDQHASRYHEFNNAPRQTRFHQGYTQTYHESEGNLDAPKFLSQLFIGLAKKEIRENKFEDAKYYLNSALEKNHDNNEEISRWLSFCDGESFNGSSLLIDSVKHDNDFSKTVLEFASVFSQVKDEVLMDDWPATKVDDDWMWYTDCIREVGFQTYQRILSLYQEIMQHRISSGHKISKNEQVLLEHHCAYMDFKSTFIGVPDNLLDKTPKSNQRSLREHIVHCMLTERWAHGQQILSTINEYRKSNTLKKVVGSDTLNEFGEPLQSYESFSELFSKFDTYHVQLTKQTCQFTDEDIEIKSLWWEPKPVSINFRLNRLGWHLRDHRVNVLQILQHLEYKSTESIRISQLILTALAKLEVALMFTDESDLVDLIAPLKAEIECKTDEIKKHYILG